MVFIFFFFLPFFLFYSLSFFFKKKDKIVTPEQPTPIHYGQEVILTSSESNFQSGVLLVKKVFFSYLSLLFLN